MKLPSPFVSSEKMDWVVEQEKKGNRELQENVAELEAYVTAVEEKMRHIQEAGIITGSIKDRMEALEKENRELKSVLERINSMTKTEFTPENQPERVIAEPEGIKNELLEPAPVPEDIAEE